MRRVAEQSLELIPAAEGAVVELVDGDTMVYVCGAGTMTAHVGTRLDRATSLSGLAIARGETLRSDDAEVDPRVDAAACRRVGARSMVCVPLVPGIDPVGVLKVASSRPGAFDDLDVAALSRLAGFIAATVSAATELAALTTGMIDVTDTDARSATVARRVSEFVVDVLQPGITTVLSNRQRIQTTLDTGAHLTLCQPIVDLASGRLVGAEALTRFPTPPPMAPDAWFADAHAAGLGVTLELAVVATALRELEALPDDCYLAVNVGPEAATSLRLAELVDGVDGSRLVLELTEHDAVRDYDDLRRAFRALRRRGVRLAIDDTGTGISGLAHILELAPDIIKLDRVLTRGIDVDPVRRALAAAIVGFAAETGASLVAEGIETVDELDTVRDLGIPAGQGFLLGRPGPCADLDDDYADRIRSR